LDSAPNPVGGAYNAPDPLAGFKKPTSKGREGAMKGKRKGEDRRREGKGGQGKRTSEHSPSSQFATTLLNCSKQNRTVPNSSTSSSRKSSQLRLNVTTPTNNLQNTSHQRDV